MRRRAGQVRGQVAEALHDLSSAIRDVTEHPHGPSPGLGQTTPDGDGKDTRVSLMTRILRGMRSREWIGQRGTCAALVHGDHTRHPRVDEATIVMVLYVLYTRYHIYA